MRRNVLFFVAVFLFGAIAGVGLGMLIGQNGADAELVKTNQELETQFNTVNDNYIVLMREYNKLFSMNPVAVSVAPADPVQVAPAPVVTQAPVDEVEEPAATDEVVETPEATEEAAEPAEEAETTEETEVASEGDENAPPVADFEALSINGTGPLDGPPPQPFQFTDKSTGVITSWEWEFGDGEKSTEQNPEHTYKSCPVETGEMCTVTLTVCGPGGCDTMTKLDYLWVSESCTGC